MTTLQDRVQDYLRDSKVAKSVFCRAISMSRTHLYKWLDGERNISAEAAERINNYLKKFSY